MDSEQRGSAQPARSIGYKRSEDFASRYANHVFFETSLWDLKLIFGQLDQQAGPNTVVQHTAITIPWSQIKVISYFLRSNLAAHEAQHGKVAFQPGIIPPVPDKFPEDVAGNILNAEQAYTAIKNLYREFAEANPEAVAKPRAEKSKKR